jgi:hypothetical protein
MAAHHQDVGVSRLLLNGGNRRACRQRTRRNQAREDRRGFVRLPSAILKWPKVKI